MMKLGPKEVEDWGNVRPNREAGVRRNSGLWDSILAFLSDMSVHHKSRVGLKSRVGRKIQVPNIVLHLRWILLLLPRFSCIVKIPLGWFLFT